MKCEILILVLALCGAFASPMAEQPETRAVSTSVQTNLTLNTVTSVTAQQTASYTALSVTFFSLNLAYFSPAIYTAYNWFLLNYMVVGTQLTVINAALTTAIGASLFPGGLCGKKSVTDSMQIIVAALEQANTYYGVMSSSGASAMSVKITAIKSLQTQINTAMSCATTSQFMSYSCSDSLFTLIAQFAYQSGSVMMTITQGWCGVCTTNTAQCAVAPTTTTTTKPATTTTTTKPTTTTTTSTTTTTTTTPTTTTTTTTPTTTTTTEAPNLDYLAFCELLLNITTYTVEASLQLSASFWELNINLFSAAISGPYNYFLLNIGQGAIQGTIMSGGMFLFGSFGVQAIESSTTVLVEVIQQACQYIMLIDAASYAEISIEISVMLSLQLELVNEVKQCKNDLSPLWHSCGWGPFKKMFKLLLMFAMLINRIIIIWCDICSAMPDFCENPFTTTTGSSTTMSTDSTSTSTEAITSSSTSTEAITSSSTSTEAVTSSSTSTPVETTTLGSG